MLEIGLGTHQAQYLGPGLTCTYLSGGERVGTSDLRVMSAPMPVGAGRRSSVFFLVTRRFESTEHLCRMRWWEAVGSRRVVRLLYGTVPRR